MTLPHASGNAICIVASGCVYWSEENGYLFGHTYLRMAPKKRTVWVVIWKYQDTVSGEAFDREPLARKFANQHADVLDIFPHEITE